MAPVDPQREFECADIHRFADAYVDGEFEAQERGLLEHHLESCGACRLELQRIAALRSLLRARITSVPAPGALRERIVVGLRQVDREHFAGSGRTVLEWRRAVLPVLAGASAAAVLSVFYLTVVPHKSDRWIVGDAAEMHARALPLEIATGQLDQLMPLFEHHLGFAVRPPAFTKGGVLLEGGRLSHLGAHDAAYLQYGAPHTGGRLSLFIVEDPGATLELDGARRALLGNREIFLAHVHGHSVVVWRNLDVVYSLVSDLGEDETLSLLAQTR
jgi:anti-sigma factor (TIGR02949 family)